MKKFVFVYFGGDQTAPEDSKKIMDQWISWMNSLGEALVDGGFPAMPATKRIKADMSVLEGKSGINGYSIVKAEDIATASEMAKGCPHLAAGGEIEIIEEMPLNM